MGTRKHVAIINYTTERIEDFAVGAWTEYAIAKLGVGLGCTVTGARCYGAKRFNDPHKFSHGPGCLKRVQTAMKDGFVELRIHYTEWRMTL
jgi:hypothetical protein